MDPVRARTVALLIGISLLFLWLRPGEGLEPGRWWVDAMFCIVIPFRAVQSIYLVRGDQAKITADITVNIGVWGYCWRVVVLYLLTVLVCGVIMLSLRAVPDRPEASLRYGLIGGALLLVALPAVCWALFSRDRRGQFDWFVSLWR